jgi:adenylate kinase
LINRIFSLSPILVYFRGFDLNLDAMLNIVLFGPPGAGKGTQSENLVARYGLVHLSTGDIFRRNIQQETDLGQLAKSYMDKGELVPDSVTIQMIEAEVNKYTDPRGFIFDGFPRTVAQAEALESFLSTMNASISCMLALEVEEPVLVERLLSRGSMSGRADDADESIIRNRISVYQNQTAPVAEHYRSQGRYFGIDGIGDIDEIAHRLYNAIDQVQAGTVQG